MMITLHGACQAFTAVAAVRLPAHASSDPMCCGRCGCGHSMAAAAAGRPSAGHTAACARRAGLPGGLAGVRNPAGRARGRAGRARCNVDARRGGHPEARAGAGGGAGAVRLILISVSGFRGAQESEAFCGASRIRLRRQEQCASLTFEGLQCFRKRSHTIKSILRR